MHEESYRHCVLMKIRSASQNTSFFISCVTFTDLVFAVTNRETILIGFCKLTAVFDQTGPEVRFFSKTAL
jgi:hypothetical protein